MIRILSTLLLVACARANLDEKLAKISEALQPSGTHTVSARTNPISAMQTKGPVCAETIKFFSNMHTYAFESYQVALCGCLNSFTEDEAKKFDMVRHVTPSRAFDHAFNLTLPHLVSLTQDVGGSFNPYLARKQFCQPTEKEPQKMCAHAPGKKDQKYLSGNIGWTGSEDVIMLSSCHTAAADPADRHP